MDLTLPMVGYHAICRMNLEPRLVADWQTQVDHLRAYEPTREETARFAPMMATYYNDAYNRSMLSNTVAMSPDEVKEHFESLRRKGGKPFLLERNGVLIGDADLRHITPKTAEFAILIGQRTLQGKGLGTRFAILLHALAFQGLGLERFFISIIPTNLASQHMFAKLGYQRDDSPTARTFVDEASDFTYSISRTDFETAHASQLPQIRWALR